MVKSSVRVRYSPQHKGKSLKISELLQFLYRVEAFDFEVKEN